MSRFLTLPRLRVPGEERHATWLELFFDLIFAVIVSELGTRLFYHFTFFGLLLSSALFFPVIWTWASYTVFADRFDNNDGVHWLLTFVIMLAGVVMAIQIPTALGKGASVFSVGFLLSQISIPTARDDKINMIFCFAIILYLLSFYILQFIAIRRFKIRGLIYATAIVATFILFLFHISSLFTMLGLTIIFVILLGIEFFQCFRQ